MAELPAAKEWTSIRVETTAADRFTELRRLMRRKYHRRITNSELLMRASEILEIAEERTTQADLQMRATELLERSS